MGKEAGVGVAGWFWPQDRGWGHLVGEVANNLPLRPSDALSPSLRVILSPLSPQAEVSPLRSLCIRDLCRNRTDKLYRGDLLHWFMGCSLGSPAMAVSHQRGPESRSRAVHKAGCLNSPKMAQKPGGFLVSKPKAAGSRMFEDDAAATG